MQTFLAINEKLAEVFPRLFNGGTAELVLTDPDKPLETGVEYMIHPPGKKLVSISHVARTARGAQSALMMPCTWCSGSTCSTRSDGVNRHASTSAETCAPMLACVVTTPLGFPVVPLV